MTITKESPISAFIKEATINKILSINEDFKKIDSWTINKYAASGVTVKDFAKIGNLSVNDFLKHIEKLGFKVDFDTETENNNKEIEKDIDTRSLKIVTLDVRPTIASGADPFNQIMQAIATLKEEETLKIINVFVPLPLINVLKSRGFKSWTDSISDKEHHTYFTKGEIPIKKEKEDNNEEKGDFDSKLASFGNKVKEIDVRHLEMPEPMVTILEEIETLPEDYVLFVNHKKLPQFLLPELKSRNFKWMHKEVEEGTVLFIVYR